MLSDFYLSVLKWRHNEKEKSLKRWYTKGYDRAAGSVLRGEFTVEQVEYGVLDLSAESVLEFEAYNTGIKHAVDTFLDAGDSERTLEDESQESETLAPEEIIRIYNRTTGSAVDPEDYNILNMIGFILELGYNDGYVDAQSQGLNELINSDGKVH